jgi:hypothetical protein
MKKRQHRMLDERRGTSRFVKDSEMEFATIVRADGEESIVPVHDESLRGLGLILDDVAHFPPGSEADIVYAGSVMRGIVRHVEPRSDGRYLVGFQCTPLR